MLILPYNPHRFSSRQNLLYCLDWPSSAIIGHHYRLEFIEKHRFPEGVLGVDSPSNPTSELYAEKRSITQRREVSNALVLKLEEEVEEKKAGIGESSIALIESDL